MRLIEKTYRERKKEMLVELKDLLQRKMSDGVLVEALSRYEEINRQKMKMHIEKKAEINAILTPVQQVQYLVFEDEFNREIREMIWKVKRSKDNKQ